MQLLFMYMNAKNIVIWGLSYKYNSNHKQIERLYKSTRPI